MKLCHLILRYYQIEVSEKDCEKTAFTTHVGLFQYNRMPFGLCNVPATFQRLMNLVLQGLNWKFCLVYIDDILIFSHTFDEHLVQLRAVFDRLRSANLKLKPSKFKFAYESTVYLGHVVSARGVSPDMQNIAAIEQINIKGIKTREHERSFLGMTGYYRRFIKNYSAVTAPLTDLLRTGQKIKPKRKRDRHLLERIKPVKFHMTREHYRICKDLLRKKPILAYPRWTVPFVIQVDASDLGIGGVLTQYQDNVEHPIGYFSRKLSGNFITIL